MKYKLTIFAVSLVCFSCQEFNRKKAAYYDQLAYEQLIAGENEAALKNYNRALALDSTLADYYFYNNRGLAKLKSGDTTGTIQDREKALMFDAEPMELAELRESLSMEYYNQGVTATDNEQWKTALQKFDKAISIYPNVADFYVNRGFVKVKLNEKDEALKDYLNAIKLDSTSALPYFNIGSLLAESKKFESGISYIIKSLTLDPDYEIGYYTLGVILFEQKRYDDAIFYLNTYRKFEQNNPETYYYLGMCYKALGNKTEARRCLELARELGSENIKKEIL